MARAEDDVHICSVCDKKIDVEQLIDKQVDGLLGEEYELISQITKKIIGFP